MKKIKILFLALFLFFPLNVLANEVDYEITNYYINADIQTNGDVKVTEVIVLDGTFNGYIRDIYYKNNNLSSSDYDTYGIYNANDLEINKIEAKYIDKANFDLVKSNDFNALLEGKNSKGGFLETILNGGKSYKMYYNANHEKVAFRLTYTLKDVIVAHNDVAELYWTFIGDEYDDSINDIQIKVNLPNIDNSDNFRAWAHGDLAGEISLQDNESILATINSLDPYSSIDIRSTFDLSLIDFEFINKKTNKNALDDILLEETQRAEIANQERQKMKTKYMIIFYSTIIWYAALLISWIYVYLKYDKEYKKNFTLKYNRDFIDDYNVEVIDYLFHKNITPNAMSASIMNLIYKKNVRFEEIASSKKKKEYCFYLDNENDITTTEKYLIDFLFTKVGKEQKFTTTDLQKYAKSPQSCEKFQTSYSTWKNKVIADGKKEGFFENHFKPQLFSLIFLILSLILNYIRYIWVVENGLTILSIFMAIIFLIYTITFIKRSKRGNEHYAKWQAFKNFLNDFGTFELKELPEIKLWERYMVYATIFGLAEKVSKIMNVKIKELETNGLLTDYYPTFTDYYVFHSLNNNFNQAIHNNSQAVASINAERINSSFSSGSGHGGGFSSGGGFGGGGGGGHGF